MFGKRKPTIPKFPLELQSLMGEWVAYFIYENQVLYHNHRHDDNLTAKFFFEHYEFNDDVFFDDYQVLKDLKILKVIIKTDKNSKLTKPEIKPQCEYGAFKELIFNNLCTLKKPIIDYFLESVSSANCLTKSERSSFEIELKCLPLFNSLQHEGYVHFHEGKYYWTRKIRPVMEANHHWKPKGYISREEKFVKKIPIHYSKVLNECASRQDIISGSMILRQLPEVQTNRGVKQSHKLDPMEIMRILYPKVWPKEQKHIVWKWFGKA